METWKDIRGYEGRYQVSNKGNVRSLSYCRSGNPHNLKPILKSIGYFVVSLGREQRFIHRLVADAFCHRTDGRNCVDHINTITTDNRAENLRWVTPCENIHNPFSETKRLKEVKRASNKKCVQLDLSGNVIRVWNSLREACNALGMSAGNLTTTCQGKQLTCGGYKWRYYDL